MRICLPIGPDAGDLARDPALDPTLDRRTRRRFPGRARAGAAGALTAALPVSGPAQDAAPPKRALDDESLKKSDLTFPSTAGAQAAHLKAFLARPKTEGRRGAVIVVHEIFGLTDHIKDVACRLAQAGYLAVAPDLFSREGGPPPLSGGFGPVREFVDKIPDSRIMEDLKALSHYLRAQSDSNAKVGIVGFCWGGRVSMLYDASDPDLNAAVAYYGRISGAPAENQPASPIDLVERMRAPLLGQFGEQDQGIPPAEAENLRAALQEHQKTAEIYVYAGAGHAFNNDTRESYHADAAHLAWKRTLDWFARYLGR